MVVVFSTEAMLRHMSRTCTYLAYPLHEACQVVQESRAVCLVRAYRAKKAERAGHKNPDHEDHHDGSKGHSSQGVIADGHSVQHRGNAEAHQREQVGCQEHGGDPSLASIAGIEATAACRHTASRGGRREKAPDCQHANRPTNCSRDGLLALVKPLVIRFEGLPNAVYWQCHSLHAIPVVTQVRMLLAGGWQNIVVQKGQ